MLTDPYNPSLPETFTVSYGVTTGQLNMQTPSIMVNPTSQTYTIQLDLLQPATVYFYRIESRNRFESRLTGVRSFTTSDSSKCNTHTFRDAIVVIALVSAVSSEVTEIQVSSTNDTTLLLSWEPPANPNGIILSYTVSVVNLADFGVVRHDSTVSTTFSQTDLGSCSCITAST